MGGRDGFSPMLYVSPFVEGLRARPRLVFWAAALIQAVVWVLVPSIFYASPPGDLPQVLAVGHEWQAGSLLGPPLSNWLAEIAYTLSGHHLFGVYVLSQVCVVVTYWAVFTLGRAIVGAKHAAIATLLMAGIFIFSVPSPDFGPAILGMPFAALALLHYWRALGEGRPLYWYALAADLGLMFMATYVALILFVVMAVFTVATERGRAALATAIPWAALLLTLWIASPHLVWLAQNGIPSSLSFGDVVQRSMASAQLGDWLRLAGGVVLAHIGLVLLVVVAMKRGRPAEVPIVARNRVQGFAKTFVYFFALMPALLGMVVSVLVGQQTLAGGGAPLVVLSALGIVVAAGDVIAIRRQRVLAAAWVVLLIGPAFAIVAAIILFPWTIGVDLRTNEPAAAMARFFTDSFNRRTGKSLDLVIGDARLVGLVALGSRDRPRVMFGVSSENSPWVSDSDIAGKGAIVIWRATDAAGAPPAAIRARFPNLVAEMPRAFERPIQGRLPLMRVGWAMIRPQAEDKRPTTEGAR